MVVLLLTMVAIWFLVSYCCAVQRVRKENQRRLHLFREEQLVAVREGWPPPGPPNVVEFSRW